MIPFPPNLKEGLTFNEQTNYGGVMDDIHDTADLISRMRNRNVAQLLDDLGEQPPMLVRSIKRQFTRFANDIQEMLNDDTDGNR